MNSVIVVTLSFMFLGVLFMFYNVRKEMDEEDQGDDFIGFGPDGRPIWKEDLD